MKDDATPQITISGDVGGQVAIGSTVTQSQTTTDRSETDDSITVLFWAANPIDTEPLRLGEEVRTIDERIRGTTYAGRIELEQQWAVRYTDLSDGLLRYAPTIVHFSGHGDANGTLVLEDADGRGRDVSIDALAELFRVAGAGVRLVVFNACYSADQAAAVAAHVECVVGTTRAIQDASALAFAGGFYRGIGYGRSVESAFELGRNEVELAGLVDHDVPQLLSGEGMDPAELSFF